MPIEIKLGKRYFASDLEREGYRVANVYLLKDPLNIERYGRIGIQYRKGTENLLFTKDSAFVSTRVLKLLSKFDKSKGLKAEIANRLV